VAPYLDQAEQVFIIPDGQIHLVNLAALPHQDGGYLIESGHVFHVLTAERDLIQSPRHACSPDVLVMGAPDFEGSAQTISGVLGEGDWQSPFRGERPSCEGLSSMQFSPLPAALDEVREVAELWESEPGVHLMVGKSASEGTFKKLAPSCGILHVATHGFFLSGECPSGLAGTRGIGVLVPEDSEGAPQDDAGQQATVNPLLLSGLALAGANHRSSSASDREDGILTAQEIAALDLSSVRLAVLSACETGAGEVLSGEGIFGLRRAFRIAGVGTLVTSLWSVQDQAARDWMASFYQASQTEGLPISEAVRKANLRILSDRRAGGVDPHPFYWAAFVASGDWR